MRQGGIIWSILKTNGKIKDSSNLDQTGCINSMLGMKAWGL